MHFILVQKRSNGGEPAWPTTRHDRPAPHVTDGMTRKTVRMLPSSPNNGAIEIQGERSMRSLSWTISILVVLSASAAIGQETDWQKVDDALGRKATVSGDVH